MEKKRLVRIFDKQANQYDRRTENPAHSQWRQQLFRYAHGNVLELAVGAGANFPYYPLGVQVTAVDFSPGMIEKAKRRAQHLQVAAEFMCADMEEADFGKHAFDTIVSTMSFCSYEQPLELLKKVRLWCKPEGDILLLEHGISSSRIVSSLQKTLDPLLYRAYGCHHTRNILELAEQAGLNVVAVDSYWKNMIHLVRAKPGTATR
ncbi:class I SAM-dependent methyltransferase [Paenibacillus macerans]|uniref:class I SAM-dependent methyltransferase n=1 Tax=Paenibacillus macerans TaxID=44252 RepID=UPI003D318FB6